MINLERYWYQKLIVYKDKLEYDIKKYQSQLQEVQKKYEKEYADNLKLMVATNKLKIDLENCKKEIVELNEKYEKEVSANHDLILDSLITDWANDLSRKLP